MTNYKTGLYIGNIMEVKDNKITIYKKDAMLIYNEENDMFTSIEELNNFIDRDLNTNLTDKQREEIIKSINKNSYHYSSVEGQYDKYIDENSIEEFYAKKR